MELLRPRGTPRLRLLAAGFYADGRLAPLSSVTVWGAPARLAFRAQEPAVVTVGDSRIALRAGERQVVEVEVAGTLPVTVRGTVFAERPELSDSSLPPNRASYVGSADI